MGLTEKRIHHAKPGANTAIIWDRQVTGLGVRITPKGSKSFVLRYRIAGKYRVATLGSCDEVSLRGAREQAILELANVRRGGDPLRREPEPGALPTVADLVQRFLEQEAPARIKMGRLKNSTLEWYGQLAKAHVLPVIGKHKVADVTRGDIENMVAKLSGPSRNATLALASRLFTLAERWEWRPQHANPARGVERARLEARDRVLSPAELAALAAALNEAEARSPANVAAIRFAAVTGLRIGEVLAVRWEHVDMEGGRLLLPDTKTGRRHHDLPTPALEVLAGTDRFNGGSGWVFSNDDGRSRATYKRVRATFDRVSKAAGLEDVRLHDLRRTVMTNAAAAGATAHILRDLLGHKTTAMADRYIRSVGDPVRQAREAVAGQMAAMMEGREPAKVAPLREKQ